jgi:hypothetical protein
VVKIWKRENWYKLVKNLFLKMIKELDLVVLTHDIEVHHLKAGDVGTVVHCYNDNAGFEVEFVTAEGKTIGVLTLTTADIRSFEYTEILHSRDVAPIAA